MSYEIGSNGPSHFPDDTCCWNIFAEDKPGTVKCGKQAVGTLATANHGGGRGICDAHLASASSFLPGVRANEVPPASVHDGASLKLLDAAMLILGASWEVGNKCDGSTVSAAIRILEQLERRLVAGKL